MHTWQKQQCRYNEWVARQGSASEALKEACRLVLQYAQQVCSRGLSGADLCAANSAANRAFPQL